MKQILIIILLLLNLNLFAVDAKTKTAKSSASAQSDRKTVCGILMDNSGSLRQQIPQIRKIAKGLVSRLHQSMPISLFTFTRQGDVLVPKSEVERSQDDVLLNKHVDGLKVSAGRTTLLDSIHLIAKQLDANNAEVSQKILILVTDGEDRRSSQVSETQLIKELKDTGFKVYAIGLVQELDDTSGLIRKSPKEMAVQLLSRLAKETGGRVVFAKGIKPNVDTLLNELLTP